MVMEKYEAITRKNERNFLIKSGKNKMNIMEIVKDKKYFCHSNLKNGNLRNYQEIQEIRENRIYFSPYGGGFVHSINLDNEKFLNDVKDKKIIFTNDKPKEEYHYGKIYIDGYGDYPNSFVMGYIHKNLFWNGWRIVAMTTEGIKKHNSLIKQSGLDCGEFDPTFLFIDDDTIVLKDPEEEGGKLTIKSHEITFEGKKIKVFDPCSMGWTWQEIEEENK